VLARLEVAVAAGDLPIAGVDVSVVRMVAAKDPNHAAVVEHTPRHQTCWSFRV
jgi:hypothetical protein